MKKDTQDLLTGLFNSFLEAVADDPSCVIGIIDDGDRNTILPEEVAHVISVAKDLGIDAWAFWEEHRSEHEVNRLREILDR